MINTDCVEIYEQVKIWVRFKVNNQVWDQVYELDYIVWKIRRGIL